MIDKMIKDTEKIISVKTIKEGIDKVSNPFCKKLISGNLLVNGYYAFVDSGVKTLIFWEA